VGVGGIAGGAWILMLGDARGHHSAFDMSQPAVARLIDVECVLQNVQIFNTALTQYHWWKPRKTHILSPPATSCLADDAQVHPSPGPEVDIG